MLDRAIYDSLTVSWPMILIFCIVISTVRIFYLKINHKKFIFWKESLGLLFVIYILILFELVTNADRGLPGFNIIPFREITRYNLKNELFYYNIMGNILLFLPFGFVISNFINIKKISQISLLILIISSSIEFIQYFIGRAFDIDDIILNVLGGILGFILYISVTSIQNYLPRFFRGNTFYNILCVILFVILGYYFYQNIGLGWVL